MCIRKIAVIVVGVETANDTPSPQTPSGESAAPCPVWASCENQLCFDFGCQTVLHKDCPPSCRVCHAPDGRVLQ